MSKADSSPSTAASASKSRRDVILGTSGIAAGALSTTALALPEPSTQFSPEFPAAHGPHGFFFKPGRIGVNITKFQ